MYLSTNLSTCTAVVSPPRQGKVTSADHAHGGPCVRDPNGGCGSQRWTINAFAQIFLDESKNDALKFPLAVESCTLKSECLNHSDLGF